MRIGREDPWALTELAKPRRGLRGTPHLGIFAVGALVCDGAITGCDFLFDVHFSNLVSER